MVGSPRDSRRDSICTRRTLLDILAQRAAETPERSAYAFLADGEAETARVSYAELWRSVHAWASEIHTRTPPDARVLLLLPAGLDFLAAFLGSLEAGRIAVPAYPPPPYRASRIRAIAANAQPALVLAPRKNLEAIERALNDVDTLGRSDWMGVEDVDLTRADRWSGVPLDPARTAFLQYTSGSTSAPKGVRVTHANLMHNEECIRVAFGLSADTTVVSWLPLFHDMGLVGTMLQPLYVGALGVLIPAAAFLQRPVRWLDAIARYHAHTSGGPNFAYDLCTRKVTPAESAELDLSSWTVAFNGAEPVRAETLEAFAARFSCQGFRAEAFTPCYGLAEATLMVSSRRSVAVRRVSALSLEQGRLLAAHAGDPERALVSCGPPCEPGLRIVRPDTRDEAEPGEIGEIWITGPSVADGYWREPEATAESFAARLASSGEGPFLRTGDLGILQDGELYITGRLKDLIILRGANHYPQDIESTVHRCHPALKAGGAAAFTADVDQDGEERLVVVQEVEREALRHLNANDVGDAAREAVFREHGLELAVLALVKPGGVPKTSSGKLQRSECRSGFLGRTLPLLAESRPLRTSAGVWARLAAAATQDGMREVLHCGTRVLRLDELLKKSSDVARRLAAAGMDKTSTVRVLVDPSPEALTGLLAAWLIGATVIPVGSNDPHLTEVVSRLTVDGTLFISLSPPLDPDAAGSSSGGPQLIVRIDGSQRETSLNEEDIQRYAERFADRLHHGSDPTLVCALDRPDGPAALDWIATLLLGGRIVFVPETGTGGVASRKAGFSLLYFSANEAEFGEDKYTLFLESARFADRHGFEAVWTPERHFHSFGGLYPNPSVLSAALAMITGRIRLRAGSVVLPLHHPIRVVEEWAVVDNLSSGRVDLAFARGWNANDFVFAPHQFASSREVLFRDVEIVRRLWRGEAMTLANGQGHPVDVRVHPLPQQPELNVWITCSGGPERFEEAGAAGANVLTALLFQSIEELAGKIARYRRARANNGHDPDTGRVTLMLHTFIGSSTDAVREAVHEPFIDYLRTSVDLWRHGSKSLDDLSEKERGQLLEYAFERYFQTSALFGTPSDCLDRVEELLGCGVDEIACLIDFGVPVQTALSALEPLDELRRAVNGEKPVTSLGDRLGAVLDASDACVLQCTAEQAGALAAAQPARTVRCLVQGTPQLAAVATADAGVTIVDRSRLLGTGAVARPSVSRVPTPGRQERPFGAPERELLRWLHGLGRRRLATVLEVTPGQVSIDQSFSQLGIDSLKGIEIIGRLSEDLGVELSPTLLFEFPTLAKLSEHLVRTHASALERAAEEHRSAVAAQG